MFDLEQHIREWRQAQTAALGGRTEAIDELESHLREEMNRLVQSGQAMEQAWDTALTRLGAPGQLAIACLGIQRQLILGNNGFTFPPSSAARTRRSSSWPGWTHTSSCRTCSQGCLKLKLW
jgi:hypothetical protein